MKMPRSFRAAAGLFLLVCFPAVARASLRSQGNATPGSAAQPAAVQQLPAQTPSSSPQTETRNEVKGYTLTPEKYAKAVAYSNARYRLHFIDFVYGLLVLILVLRWRLAPKFRDWAEAASPRRFLQAVIFVPPFFLTLAVLGLPTEIYGHWLSRTYDISVQGWGSWLWDWTKGELIGFLIGIILVWILYAVIRRSARRWWFYFWLTSLPILVFLIFIAPLVIDPLFNKFESLEKTQPALVDALERVVHRAGMDIPTERMFLMKASEKTKGLNAYVTGFGSSKRVVVWDTTIAKMTTPETVFVFGHEMGHYVLNHVYKGIVYAAVLLFVLFYLGYVGIGRILARYGLGWSIRGLNDWASLPALLLLLSVFGFLTEPIGNTFSRHIEHEADIYGLEVTHGLIPNSSQVAASAFQILGEVNLSDPHPSKFIKIWLYNHPPLDERVQFTLEYDPWSKGESPEFVK